MPFGSTSRPRSPTAAHSRQLHYYESLLLTALGRNDEAAEQGLRAMTVAGASARNGWSRRAR
ncbi:hypothetical protein [Paractinoplanes atraurantiacus]|uniref:hypothetical protein n=1 Tax=Paractinoplanes atraurantiacus TaxID=1036182 RepID=UPI000BE23757|nr:hypothetical protein [Actinoplanes atraurantiacus]